MNSSGEEFDAIVIGGGVIGAAVVLELARRGRRVLLCEQGTLAGGSTGASIGIVRVFHLDEVLAELAAESFPRFLGLGDETGEPGAFTRTGLLFLVPGEAVLATQGIVARLCERGATLEVLSPEEGALRFPHLEWRGVGAAVLEPLAGFADPARTARAWINLARRSGAAVREGLRVARILRDDRGVAGVETTAGTLRARAVVLAAGAWSAPLAATIGIDVPVRSKVIEVSRCGWSERFTTYPGLIDETTALYGRPDRDGRFLIGMPTARWDVDPGAPLGADAAHAECVRERAPARMPSLGDAAIDSAAVGCDGYTEDGRGVLRAIDAVAGLCVATGFSGGGFKIAPAVGRVAADIVMAGIR
jgi:glycine/D-amino acid oxidase-like deaminating enzyme